MKTAISLAALLLAFTFGIADRAQAQEHSMTGCLAKGDDPGTFKLTDLPEGPKVVVTSTFACDFSIDRIGAAISPGESPAVATW